MTLPGHTTILGERVRARFASPSTANGFVVGFTERGPSNEAVLCRSLAEYVEVFGERVSYGVLYDSLDASFREGVGAVYVGRIVGPTPVIATDNLASAGGDVLKVDALSAGAWGNDIDVACDATGANFVLTVTYAGTQVEVSPTLATNDEAVAWAAASSYIRITKLGATDPIDGTANLAGGDDDHASSTDATRRAALALFPRDLGPGNVAQPGFTTSQSYLDLLAHCVANNRRALLDGPDTPTVATLTAASLALRTAPNEGARYGQMLAPWATIPGLSPGTFRTVPYSAVQMGLIAKAEAETQNPNQAAAGKRGRSSYAVGLSQAPWTDAEREILNDSGVSVARVIRDTVTTYGNRTLANPLTDGDWKSFSGSRVMMLLAANADLVMEDYDFEELDGWGHVFAKLEGDLSGRACMPLYALGALYGNTPAEAFSVNTGSDVNTPQTIADEQIKAVIGARVSPTGEEITTEIVKVPTTEAV